MYWLLLDYRRYSPSFYVLLYIYIYICLFVDSWPKYFLKQCHANLRLESLKDIGDIPRHPICKQFGLFTRLFWRINILKRFWQLALGGTKILPILSILDCKNGHIVQYLYSTPSNVGQSLFNIYWQSSNGLKAGNVNKKRQFVQQFLFFVDCLWHC